MNDLQIFKNIEFGEVRVIEINNEPWLVGKDIADCLGYNEPHKAIARHIDEEDRMKHPIHTNGGIQESWIINESGLYSLILSSELPSAKKFKNWVTKEVLPSIRKHGAYMTDNVIEQMLNNPEFGIKLLTELKIGREEKLKLQKEVEYKTEVIRGITEDIDIYTKRNVLNKVVRYKGSNFKARWTELYARFREVYHIDLKARCEGYNLKQVKKKDQLSTIKYAEQFGYLDNLYKVAVRLYETDVNEILEQLKQIA